MNAKAYILWFIGFNLHSFCVQQTDQVTLFNSIDKYDRNLVDTIEIAAVGRVGNLGDLYDARSDKFLHLSIFNKTLNRTSLIDNRGTKLQYTLVNTFAEKFSTLDISAELKLSILGGLFELKGSGRFFKDTKSSARSAKASMIHSCQTSYEKININDGSLKPFVDFNLLEMIDATHVVVGTQWGGNVFISVEDANTENRDVQIVEGEMGVQMKTLAGLIGVSGNGNVNISESELNKINKFSFEVYGDILPDDVPQTLIDAILFMKTAPKKLQDANNGKGKAMSYQLIPVSILRKLWNLNLAANSIINKIDEATVKNCVKLFDDINKASQKVNDLVTNVENMEPYLETAKVNAVKRLKHNYDIYQSVIQQNLSETLIKVRSGSEDVNKLHNILTQSLEDPYSPENIDLVQFGDINQQISFIKLLMNLNVTMLNKRTIFQQYLWENFDNDIYILFYHNMYALNTEKTMNMFRTIVQNKQDYGPKAIFVALSHEIIQETQNYNPYNFNDTRISLFKNGALLVANYEIGSDVPDSTDPEHWSLYYIQQQVSIIKQRSTSIEQELSIIQQNSTSMEQKLYVLNNNLVPIGFIYTQIHSEPEPSALWPMYQWTDVSTSYSGQFFRVLGDGSEAFGTVQSENVPRISGVDWQSSGSVHTIGIPLSGWSSAVNTGVHNGHLVYGIRFYVTGGEVRPRNSAIRLWSRTG